MSGHRLILAHLLAATMVTAGSADAQTLAHRRRPAEPPAAPSSAPQGSARLVLPKDAEGEYRWGESGEVIELYVEDGKLGGYLTRRSERHDPRSSPITFLFAETGAGNGTLTFTTRRVHGDSYSFKGAVVRGPGLTPQQEGYYLLNGTLEVHLSPAAPGDPSASDEPIARQVSLKRSGTRP